MQLLFSTEYFIIFLLKNVYKTKTLPECLKELNNWSCLAAIVLGQKKICMFAVTQPSLVKCTVRIIIFSRESAKNYARHF